MRNYQLKMNELGLNSSNISKALQKSIKEFEEGENEFRQINDNLSKMDEQDERYESLSQEVENYDSLLNEADDDLMQKLEKYSANKEVYEAKMLHMRQKAAEKKGKVVAPAAPAAPANPANPAAPVAPAAPAASVSATTQSGNPPVIVLPKEEKKSGSNWLLWGGLAVLGLLVGVNVMKNREQ